jgi:acyl carrier protein
MSIDEFLEQFSELYDDAPSLSSETHFKSVPGWDSLVSLSLIMLASENFGKTLSGEDIKKLNTVEDVYVFLSSV